MKNPSKKRFYFNIFFIVVHIMFAIVGFSLYLFNYRVSESLLLQKTLTKQLIVAKAGSSAVENLLKSVENQLSAFVFSFSSNIDEFSHIDKSLTRSEFRAYMERSSLPINGIALFDESDRLSIIENRTHLGIGENQDFSKAEFIKWAKIASNKSNVLISGPYIGTAGASAGKIILIVTKPLYFGTKYKGALVIRILIDDFRKVYIDPLISDNDEYSYIVNSEGMVVAGRKQLLHKNLFVYAKKQRWDKYQDFIQKFGLAMEGDISQATWMFQNPNEQPKELLVGISKIDLPGANNKDLYMVVATSRESVTASLSPLKGYGVLWLGFGLLVTALGGFAVVLLNSY